MRIKCWKCNGAGRLRDKPLLCSVESAFIAVGTLGIVPFMRGLFETKDDPDYWHTCGVCYGHGFQEQEK
jgi:hypothetical protein